MAALRRNARHRSRRNHRQHWPECAVETYQKIQKRLNESACVPARKDINSDFPLRGFVICGDCGERLTGCWAKGRTSYYAYYQCFSKGCPSYGKSIPARV